VTPIGRLYRRIREAQMVAKALKSATHPILAHVVPIRRCNLSCTYCNEYDSSSAPVPTSTMLRRIDRLAAIGTANITLSGGEPMLHPDLCEIVQRIRSHGALAGLLTNGYFLTPGRIKELNRAGLDHLQISVDNVMPDEVSKKSLKVLDKKLEWLSEHAEFAVNINSVLGSSIRNPEDALTIARRAKELGLSSSIGIIHDHDGQLRPLDERQSAIYNEVVGSRDSKFVNFELYDAEFQKHLILGESNAWHCRAGARYLYICEDGLVHYCSQRRGYPAIPLEQYTIEDIRRELRSVKSCAPYCTVSCVHRVAALDAFRDDPRSALLRFFPAGKPAAVRTLEWLFLPKPTGQSNVFARIALRLLRVR
jgi:MoaA/NifB/PqqE/SkfB family radical SAM enzyme